MNINRTARLDDTTDLQAVDYAMGRIIAGAYTNLRPAGPEAFKRFLKRPNKHRIFFANNSEVQDVLRKIARHENEPGTIQMDLPLIIYYRELGIPADNNLRPQLIERHGYVRDDDTQENRMVTMRLTMLPITLTYSVLFLAWDKPSIERMSLCWWGFMAPQCRKTSRFMVTYEFAGETVDVAASISSPREILTSNEQISEGVRLWGARTMVELNTHALYGATEEYPQHITVEFNAVKMDE